MALDSERYPGGGQRLLGLREGARRYWDLASQKGRALASGLYTRLGIGNIPIPDVVHRYAAKFGKDGAWRKALLSWYNRQPLVRLISSSLAGRILASNLFGFGVLFLGILYLSLDSSWIIAAKRDALRTQGQIIAAAVSGNAVVRRDEIVVDADRLPVKSNAMFPLRDDEFAAIKLTIRPEKVAPIFRRLIEPTNTRARIYDRRGSLVVDSSDLLRKGFIDDLQGQNSSADTDPENNLEKEGAAVASGGQAGGGADGSADNRRDRPKTKNFWTRLQHLLIGKELQVYKEIGNSNGQAYPEVREALNGQDAAMLLLNTKGEQIVSVAVPITRLKKVMGVLLLSTPPGEIDKVLAESRSDLWPLAFFAGLASIVSGLMLARTVAGPMRRLSATAEHVSRDITARTTLPDYSDRQDEVGQMSKAFSAMTKSLYERIEASEKFAADVAHELKNPLTAASSMAQSLEYARTEEERGEVVQQIQNELKRLNRLISDVSRTSMLHAQLQRETLEPVKLEAVISDVVSIFKEKAEDGGHRLDYRFVGKASDFVVAGNEGRLGQVLTNLIDNALSFTAEGGRVSVELTTEDGDVFISVEDDGPGIQEDKLETIFSRFYTYRPTEYSSRGNNSGLGLSISQEIIQSHGGRIWAENRYGPNGRVGPPIGSRFIVRLPAMVHRQSRGNGRGLRG
ncbi:MAG: sensor histidine kinase [Alphaproteobacteria bacterium]|nr:sensor histidine kinase [Alphaproteobacteria bacterium]